MEAEIDLRAFVGFLRRQIWLIAFTFFAMMAAASAIILTIKPIYTASTLVMVDPDDKNLLSQHAAGQSASVDMRIEGEVLLASSDNVLLTVLDRHDLMSDRDFQVVPSWNERILSWANVWQPPELSADQARRGILDALKTRTSVKREQSTSLLSISVSASSGERAAALANAVAQAYIDAQLTAKIQNLLDAHTVLLAQLEVARSAMMAVDGSFDRYIDSNLGSIIEETGNSELGTIAADITRLGVLRDDLLSRISGSGNPNEQSADTAFLQQQLQQHERDQADRRQSLRTAVLASDLSPNTLTQLYDVQHEATLARQHYDQISARSQELQAQTNMQIADSRIVSPALALSRPSSPNTATLLALAALLSLLLSVTLAFLREHFVGGFTSAEQLARIAGTRQALTVPRAKSSSGRDSLASLLTAAPLSEFSEAVRRIRTTIDQLMQNVDGEQRKTPIVAVTSTDAHEGKTSIALAVARSYALAGRSTLLIDCDLRQPSIHQQIGFYPTSGLIDALVSPEPGDVLSRAIVTDDSTKLMVLVGSRESNEATDQLITSQNFDRLIGAASRAFDVVILDTPPLARVVDTLYLAEKADAVVFVVQWAKTSQQDVRRSMAALDGVLQDDQPIIPVLNGQDEAVWGRSRKYTTYLKTGGLPPILPQQG